MYRPVSLPGGPCPDEPDTMHEHILLEIAIMLAAAKLGGELCERLLKMPAVLAEIVVGVLLGRSVLGWLNGDSPTLSQMAEIGAVLLLFEVGLESDLEDLFRVGGAAMWVAFTGVALPFGMGYLAAGALGYPVMQSLFVGAAMTATSVGITARVFSDLHVLHTREAKIVLGAAVVDDVIGLIILAGVSALAVTKVVSIASIGQLTGLAVLFLIGAVVIGHRATPLLLHWARRMQTRAAVSSVAVIFCLLLATTASVVQLAPIVGAFAAGLVLAKTEHKIHFEPQVKAIADLFIPIFFVMMGARMHLATLKFASPAGRATLVIGGALLAVAILGKIIGGLALPDRRTKRLAVGIGMIPRGEVGLIFASIGLQSKIINDALYAAIIFVVICTTFVTPPLLKIVVGRTGLKGGMKRAAPRDSTAWTTGDAPLTKTI
jgi:Kef-type K+ transport system membrane component KefB